MLPSCVKLNGCDEIFLPTVKAEFCIVEPFNCEPVIVVPLKTEPFIFKGASED